MLTILIKLLPKPKRLRDLNACVNSLSDSRNEKVLMISVHHS